MRRKRRSRMCCNPLVRAAAIAPPTRREISWKAYAIADLAPFLDKVNSGRDYERGLRKIFRSVQCLQCHLFGQERVVRGPDLTAVANRFNRRDLLEAILEPSKAISEQYASYVVTTKGGEQTQLQLITEQNNDHVTMITDLIARTEVTISAGQVQSRKMSRFAGRCRDS